MRARPIIITAVLIAGVAVGVLALSRAKQRVGFIGCGNYLVSIGSAARLWSSDHGSDHFPPDLLSMSNEVITPKILVCPGDHSRQPAASWTSFTPEQSSFEIVTPSLGDGDTNRVFLRCKVHGSVLYGDGSVFVHGQRHYKH